MPGATFNCSAWNLFRSDALGAPTVSDEDERGRGSPRDDYSLEAERKIRKLSAAAAINLR
jgi:hypothetical protein